MCLGRGTEEVGRRGTGRRRLLEPRDQNLIRGICSGETRAACMVGFRQRWGWQTGGFLPSLLPPGDSPQLRDSIPGQSKLGFLLPASYSLHKHSRPGLCTIGTLLVVGMQLTRKSVQTERGA